MRYKNFVFVKTVVLRSCFRLRQSAGNGKTDRLPLYVTSSRALSTSSINLPARCVSYEEAKPLSSNTNLHRQFASPFGSSRTLCPLKPAPSWQSTCVHRRSFHSSDPTSSSTDGKKEEEVLDDEPIVAKYDESGKPLSNWKRMKIMMKTYGYVIIPVHWLIAPVWFGAFYYTIKMGVDIGPMLLKIGVSEHHVNSLQNSGASNALMAYALYKIFTPLRYTVTVGATEMTVRHLRRKGYIKPTPPKEKSYRDSMRETMDEMKDKAQDVKEKAQERAQDLKDKAQERRDKKEKARERTQDLKDNTQESKDNEQEKSDKRNS